MKFRISALVGKVGASASSGPGLSPSLLLPFLEALGLQKLTSWHRASLRRRQKLSFIWRLCLVTLGSCVRCQACMCLSQALGGPASANLRTCWSQNPALNPEVRLTGNSPGFQPQAAAARLPECLLAECSRLLSPAPYLPAM